MQEALRAFMESFQFLTEKEIDIIIEQRHAVRGAETSSVHRAPKMSKKFERSSRADTR